MSSFLKGMIKQLLVLPGADASQLACPTEMPKLPAISRQPDVQMMEAGMNGMLLLI